MNRFVYVHANPVDSTDLTGMWDDTDKSEMKAVRAELEAQPPTRIDDAMALGSMHGALEAELAQLQTRLHRLNSTLEGGGIGETVFTDLGTHVLHPNDWYEVFSAERDSIASYIQDLADAGLAKKVDGNYHSAIRDLAIEGGFFIPPGGAEIDQHELALFDREASLAQWYGGFPGRIEQASFVLALLGGGQNQGPAALARLPTSSALLSRVGKVFTSRFWPREVMHEGTRVYQHVDAFDPSFYSDFSVRGKEVVGTNVDRMAAGLAPIGYDGKPVNLHHLTQSADGPVAEVAGGMHEAYYGILHINTGELPSGISRPAFDKWRTSYWKSRALDYK